jgi:transposase
MTVTDFHPLFGTPKPENTLGSTFSVADEALARIVAEAKAPVAVPAVVANNIEIELADGHRMRISGGYDPESLAQLTRGLMA